MESIRPVSLLRDDSPERGFPSPSRSWSSTMNHDHSRSSRNSCSISSISESSTHATSSRISETSCVYRDTATQDCNFARFITWAAVKRNSSSNITNEDKLMCPLLQCRRRFADHEAMLGHLATCSQLHTRQYWCYEHQRAECFDDSSCKRCLGHPSKRRKIMSKAKRVLSSLGHKQRKVVGDSLYSSDSPMTPLPSAYDAAVVAMPDELELYSKEISELDATGGFNINECAASTTAYNDNLCLDLAPAEETKYREPEKCATQPERWNPFSASELFTLCSQSQSVPAADIDLVQPQTHDQHGQNDDSNGNLSHSSSVRSTTSTNSNVSDVSNASSLFSKASNWSASTSVSAMDIDYLGTANDAISPSLLCKNSSGKEVVYDAGNLFDVSILFDSVCELPADVPTTDLVGPPSCLDVPDLVPESLAASSIVGLGTTIDAWCPPVNQGQHSFVPEEVGSPTLAAHNALVTHHKVSISKLKARDMGGSSLAADFAALTCSQNTKIAIETFRRYLHEQVPSTALECLCLTHLAYSLTIATDGGIRPARERLLFRHCLHLAAHVQPLERGALIGLLHLLWLPDPLETSDFLGEVGDSVGSSSTTDFAPSSLCDSIDASQYGLLGMMANYLDVLELDVITTSNDKNSINSTPNGSIELPESFIDSANYILRTLASRFPLTGDLASKFSEVYISIQNRCTTFTVRQFELELLKVGRFCLSSDTFCDYAPYVRASCDVLYAQYSGDGYQRDVYQNRILEYLDAMLERLDRTTSSTKGGIDDETVAADPATSTWPGVEHNPDNSGKVNTVTSDELDHSKILNVAISHQMRDIGSTKETSTPTISEHAYLPPIQTIPAPSYTTTTPPFTPTTPTTIPAPPNITPAGAIQGCTKCNYKPKGDPRWFHSSLAKHMKSAHPADPVKVYKCPYPGCTSQYRNRADNLKQHQQKKGHFVSYEVEAEVEVEGDSRPPTKRKRRS